MSGGTAGEYYAAYFFEESLSIDNILVFFIGSPSFTFPRHQRRVLRFGIAGARCSGADMAPASPDSNASPDHLSVRGDHLLARGHAVAEERGTARRPKCLRRVRDLDRARRARQSVCRTTSGGADGGRLVATRLFVALVVIETTDIVFGRFGHGSP